LLENDATDAETALFKTTGGVEVGTVDTDVVCEFARFGDTGIERLAVFS
jgi:hypothetical protein